MDGITLEKLQVIIAAQTAPLQKELDKVKKSVDSATSQVSKATDKVNNKLAKMGTSLMKYFSFAAIIASITKLITSTTGLASQLEEIQNVVDVAFGNMSYKIEKFSKNALEAFGLSELSAKKTASSFMAMSVGMNISSNKSSNMAIAITALSADMASFYNITHDMATTALSSIWTGETETLKRYGIVMTEVNLQHFALSNGINKNINSMTQAEKTTLRYLYVTDALRLAQGDFARTSNSWANQIRILQERFKALSTIIGSGIIAALTPLVQFINLVVSKLLFFAQVLQTVFSSLFGKKSNPNAGAVDSANEAAKAQGGYTNALKKSDSQAKKNQKTLAGFDEINNIGNQSSSGTDEDPTAGGGDGFGINFDDMDFGEPDTTGIDNAATKVRLIIENLLSFLDNNKAMIYAIIGGIAAFLLTLQMPVIIGSITTAIAGLVGWFSNFGLAIKNFGLLKTVLSGIGQILGGVSWPLVAIATAVGVVTAAIIYLWNTSEDFRNNIITIISGISSVVNDLWNNVLAPLFSLLANMIESVLNPLGTLMWDVLCNAVIQLSGVLSALWMNILQPLSEFIINILAVTLNGLLSIWIAMKPAVQDIMSALSALWTGILEPLVNFIVDVIIGAIERMGTSVQTVIALITNVFTVLITFITNNFLKKWELAWNTCKSVFGGVWNTVIGIVESAVNHIITGINWCIDQLNKISIDVPSWVTALTGMTTFGFSITHLNDVQLPRVEIPKLANGGLAYGPTLSVVGDNVGASSDPEVIAPLSKLQNLMGYSNVEMINALYKMYEILIMIYEKDNSLVIDGEKLADKLNKINRDNERKNGVSTFDIER